MHWLEQKVEWLSGLFEAHRRGERAMDVLLQGVHDTVHDIARHRGITACFASHEGLALEAAGRAPDFDALSAMSQYCMMQSRDVGRTLSLGRVRQMVIVGGEHKLA